MSISIRRYVDISSGVAAAAGVARRELIGRFFSESLKVPGDAVVEIDSASEAISLFGANSSEALAATAYFGYVSKSTSRAKKLSFARWAKTASEARIFGGRVSASLATLKAIVAGTMDVTVGGQVATLTAVDLSGANSYADAAALLQTAFRTELGSQFTTSTVVYDAVAGAFNFTSSDDGPAGIEVTTPGTLAGPLAWGATAIFSPGVAAATPVEAVTASQSGSTNFGSFLFLSALTDDELVAVSAWNAAQNVEYLFSARVTSTNAAAISAATIGNLGTGLTLAPLATEFDEVLPMAIMAATNYSRRNAAQNYMYQQGALSPKVTNDADADVYDNLRVNYYGVTQTAGQLLAFYQRGVLTGTNTAPTDMNTYANEIWLKDAARVALLGAFMALPRVPANEEGRSVLLGVLQGPIDQALINGTISIGKPLSEVQKIAIADITDDVDAWHQIQGIGYWLDVVIHPVVVAGKTEFQADYVLVYAKDDAVRKVNGEHILI